MLEQIEFSCLSQRLSSATDVELAIDLIEMPLGRPFGDREPRGYVAVGQPIGHQPQNRHLSLAKPFDRRSLRTGRGRGSRGPISRAPSGKSFLQARNKIRCALWQLRQKRLNYRAFFEEDAAVSFGRGQTKRLFQ